MPLVRLCGYGLYIATDDNQYVAITNMLPLRRVSCGPRRLVSFVRLCVRVRACVRARAHTCVLVRHVRPGMYLQSPATASNAPLLQTAPRRLERHNYFTHGGEPA